MYKKSPLLITSLFLCFLALTLVWSVPTFAFDLYCFLIIVEESTNNLHEGKDGEAGRDSDLPLRDDFPREQNPGGKCLKSIICNVSSCYTEVDSLGFIKGTNTPFEGFVRSNSDYVYKGSSQVIIGEVALKEKAEFGIKTVNFLSKVCRIVLRSLGHYKIA